MGGIDVRDFSEKSHLIIVSSKEQKLSQQKMRRPTLNMVKK